VCGKIQNGEDRSPPRCGVLKEGPVPGGWRTMISVMTTKCWLAKQISYINGEDCCTIVSLERRASEVLSLTARGTEASNKFNLRIQHKIEPLALRITMESAKNEWFMICCEKWVVVNACLYSGYMSLFKRTSIIGDSILLSPRHVSMSVFLFSCHMQVLLNTIVLCYASHIGLSACLSGSKHAGEWQNWEHNVMDNRGLPSPCSTTTGLSMSAPGSHCCAC
jgi:hypothetical protein